MKLHMIKQELKNGFKLVPYSENDDYVYAKIKLNTVYRVDIKQPRNLKLHNKWFAVCRMMMDQGEFKSEKQASNYLLIKAGHYTAITVNESVTFVPDSINFDTLDNLAFQDLYDICMPYAAEYIKCTERQIEDNEVFYM